jgi:signal transduction histidine kinase
MEILGRQLLFVLKADGIITLTIGSATGGDAWMSLHRYRNRTTVKEIERLPQEQVAAISDGETIGDNTLKYLWAGIEVAAGIWVSTQAGYYLALGFEDRKHINPKIAERIKELIEMKAKDDSAHLIKSFEKLKTDFQKLVKSERAAAITETTVTINHEINNPLTAILGNTQLMLMSRDKLPPDMVSKLETIERSAIKIRETTAKLMSIIEPITSPYATGLEMIDIEKSKKKKP